MNFQRPLNYCGECGTKLKDMVVDKEIKLKVRYCKKCKIYLPNEARCWVAFSKYRK